MIKLYLSMRRYATLFLIFVTSVALAQERVVTGKVTSSDDGSAIPGVNILEKGTSNGTVSDTEGNYRMNVGANATLVFSFVGYTSQEVVVGSQSTINITLQSDVTALSEVVVVGYGTTKVKDATGAVVSINSENFNKGVISTPEQLFQGRTPGVTITPSSGEPGAATTINIRGTSSIRGNQEPLYVIDGVPVDNGSGTAATQSGIEGTSTPKNPLLFLNPNDIESISVLKDASSAAIYGSRGANGVILITTKSGKGTGKKGAFSFSAYTSFATAAKKYDLLNAQDFLSGVRAANIAAGTPPADATDAVSDVPVNQGSSTDWQDQILRTAVSNGYNLGWGMSNGGTTLRLSGSYDNQQGIVKNSGLQRLTGRINLTQKFLDDKLRFDLSLTASNVKNSYAPNTNNAGYQGSLIGAAISFNPTAPIYKNGAFFDPKDGNRNPVEMLSYFKDSDNINRYLGNISASYQLTTGLVFKSLFGYNKSTSDRRSFADPRLSSNAFGGTTNVFGVNYNNQIEGNGRAVYQNNDNSSVLTEQTLTYDKTIGSSVLNAVAGYSYQDFINKSDAEVAWGLPKAITGSVDRNFINDWKPTDFTNSDIAYLPSYSKTSLQSFFGRVNYSINDKYFLTGTLRIDGSSKFGANNKYGTFPAFAGKWKLNKEGFFANSIGKRFSEFGVRVNWGQIGSQDGLGAYDAVDYSESWIPRGNTTPSTNFLHQGNKDLKWETATTTGVGLDWATSNNRLSGTVDYYHTQRKNLLFFGPVPGGFSATTYAYQNLPGFVLNQGLEFSVKYEAIVKSKFNWNIAYNMTFFKNRMQDFTQPPVNTGAVSGQGLSGAYAQTITNGYSLFTWKMPVFNGFDANGYATYSEGGKDQLLKSAIPTFTAGLTNNFSYGNWNLSVFLTTSRGFYVYNNTANALFLMGSLKTAHNVTYDVINSNENPINPGSVSTRFLEKGDFIRLQNAQLSYNFKVNGDVIKSLSANLTGQNLLLITDYSGLDPEINVDKNINGVPSRGFDYAGYPRPRTVTLGLNIGF
jgi:TonB-dependent starch-binding outer membrane protein SusC